jgi:hypothetical protein
MNAPDRKARAALSPGQIERAAELRELIHAQMFFAVVYAGVTQDFAQVADDRGMRYGLEKLALYTKTALSLRADLDAILRDATPRGESA